MNGIEFREYIESKYRGRIVTGPFNNSWKVEELADLRFDMLDLDDQKLCVSPEVQYGWAVGDKPTLEDSSKLTGFLFTQANRDFWLSPEKYLCIIGAFGSSKTFIMDLKIIDTCIKWPGTEALVMRQTFRQLLDTTIGSMFKIFSYLGWSEGVHWTHHITNKEVHLLLDKKQKSVIKYRPGKEEGRGFDEIVEDLKGMECDLIGIDEAPSLKYEIFQVLTGRLGRGIAVKDPSRRQLLAVGNPPDTDNWVVSHWIRHCHHTKEKEPLVNPGDYMVFFADQMENRANLDPANIEQVKALPSDLRKRYHEGKLTYIPSSGIPVFESFLPSLHMSKDPIPVLSNEPVFRGVDGGPTDRNKALVCCQLSNDRRTLNVLHEFLYDGAGIDSFGQLCQEQCMQKFPNARFIDIGDPKLLDKSQTDLQSPADILRKYGFQITPAESNYDIRKNSLDVYLTRIIEGKPSFQIDARCRMLIKGLRGEYRYAILNADEGMVSLKPIKNIYSHYVDALMGVTSKLTRHTTSKKETEKRWAEIKRRNPKYYRGDKERPESIRRFKNKYTSIQK